MLLKVFGVDSLKQHADVCSTSLGICLTNRTKRGSVRGVALLGLRDKSSDLYHKLRPIYGSELRLVYKVKTDVNIHWWGRWPHSFRC